MRAAALLGAAVLLREYSGEIQESCRSGDREWACADCAGRQCDSRDRFEEVVDAAKDLETAMRELTGGNEFPKGRE